MEKRKRKTKPLFKIFNRLNCWNSISHKRKPQQESESTQSLASSTSNYRLSSDSESLIMRNQLNNYARKVLAKSTNPMSYLKDQSLEKEINDIIKVSNCTGFNLSGREDEIRRIIEDSGDKLSFK
ncbi:hypothetical protein Tco_0732825 [Tanacetum coccineum]